MRPDLICEKTIEIDELVVNEYLAHARVVVKCNVTPGEPMVRYYPDGSGYPGCPPTIEAEVLDYNILHVYDSAGEEISIALPREAVLDAICRLLDDDRLWLEFEADIESYGRPDDYEDDRWDRGAE